MNTLGGRFDIIPNLFLLLARCQVKLTYLYIVIVCLSSQEFPFVGEQKLPYLPIVVIPTCKTIDGSVVVHKIPLFCDY